MRKIFFSVVVLGFAQAGFGECIDLDSAWQRIVCRAPSIAAADAEISILEGEAEQVSLRPNPFLEVESENLGVSDPSDDVEPPQTTIRVEQLVEFPGKRAARFRLASSVSQGAYWEAQIERENLYNRLVQTFIETAVAQERWRIATEQLETSEKILTACRQQVQNGKVAPVYEKRVRIQMLADRLAVREAFACYEEAKMRLASMWGSSCPDFDEVAFDLYSYLPPPCEAASLDCYYQTPDYRLAVQGVQSASKNVTLQRVNRIPDVTVMAGYRHFHDTNTGGFVVGAEMPLPFFDRNQGLIKSAHSGLSQANYILDEVTREAREKITLLHHKLAIAFEDVEMMCREIVREARETVDLTRAGYERGKFAYLDLLEAQKMYQEVQAQFLTVLCDYHQNRAELARISGMRL